MFTQPNFDPRPQWERISTFELGTLDATRATPAKSEFSIPMPTGPGDGNY
jgi:hypothetical protein